ncbi:DUF952 domain-containing protein [Bacillus luteolus]|uniref:DUF952 domain-containing protein n=1 Tax=Litchfieldia luteola TaxID=682179 RepID=A0ABR9QMK7_9BACI|nr:DUF952 domain-containing protein [Cytobacillus luteolus]MBE4909733.1 DUF952 domain-containing protein [Cytobacillus luteolus]MBP1944525.1 uncharacterized protein (DUF952 family) [Cytobacillus luteolus]
MILHILEVDTWLKAKNEGMYTPSSLEDEGFIHCSTKDQVLEVANFLYKGQENLVLLCIDSIKVRAEIVYEDLYETGKLYPHIYGGMNVDAVANVVPFLPNSDGTFRLPKELKE